MGPACHTGLSELFNSNYCAFLYHKTSLKPTHRCPDFNSQGGFLSSWTQGTWLTKPGTVSSERFESINGAFALTSQGTIQGPLGEPLLTRLHADTTENFRMGFSQSTQRSVNSTLTGAGWWVQAHSCSHRYAIALICCAL